MSTAAAPTRHGQRTPLSLVLYLLAVLALVTGPMALFNAPVASASDASLADCKVYDFTYDDGHTDAGTYCDKGMNVTQDNTPGLHVPTLHVSCSDMFTDGTSDGSSDLGGHTVADWSVVRYDKDGEVKKTCGSPQDEEPEEPEEPGVTCPEQDMTLAELATALWQAGSDVRGGHDAQGTQATVVLPEGFCEAEVNFTSYSVPDDTLEPFGDLVLFENKTVTVTPETTPLTLDIGVPTCNWHTALYTGPVIDVPPHPANVLIDWGQDLSLGGCDDGDDGDDGDDATDEVGSTTDEVCVGDMTIRVVVAGSETLVPGSVVTVDGQQLALASGQQSLTDLDCGPVDTTIDDVPAGFAMEPPTSQQATIDDGGVAAVTYEVSRVLGVVLTAEDDTDQAPASLPAAGSPAMLLLGVAAAAAVTGSLMLRGSASTRRREPDTA